MCIPATLSRARMSAVNNNHNIIVARGTFRVTRATLHEVGRQRQSSGDAEAEEKKNPTLTRTGMRTTRELLAVVKTHQDTLDVAQLLYERIFERKHQDDELLLQRLRAIDFAQLIFDRPSPDNRSAQIIEPLKKQFAEQKAADRQFCVEALGGILRVRERPRLTGALSAFNQQLKSLEQRIQTIAKGMQSWSLYEGSRFLEFLKQPYTWLKDLKSFVEARLPPASDPKEYKADTVSRFGVMDALEHASKEMRRKALAAINDARGREAPIPAPWRQPIGSALGRLRALRELWTSQEVEDDTRQVLEDAIGVLELPEFDDETRWGIVGNEEAWRDILAQLQIASDLIEDEQKVSRGAYDELSARFGELKSLARLAWLLVRGSLEADDLTSKTVLRELRFDRVLHDVAGAIAVAQRAVEWRPNQVNPGENPAARTGPIVSRFDDYKASEQIRDELQQLQNVYHSGNTTYNHLLQVAERLLADINELSGQRKQRDILAQHRDLLQPYVRVAGTVSQSLQNLQRLVTRVHNQSAARYMDVLESVLAVPSQLMNHVQTRILDFRHSIPRTPLTAAFFQDIHRAAGQAFLDWRKALLQIHDKPNDSKAVLWGSVYDQQAWSKQLLRLITDHMMPLNGLSNLLAERFEKEDQALTRLRANLMRFRRLVIPTQIDALTAADILQLTREYETTVDYFETEALNPHWANMRTVVGLLARTTAGDRKDAEPSKNFYGLADMTDMTIQRLTKLLDDLKLYTRQVADLRNEPPRTIADVVHVLSTLLYVGAPGDLARAYTNLRRANRTVVVLRAAVRAIRDLVQQAFGAPYSLPQHDFQHYVQTLKAQMEGDGGDMDASLSWYEEKKASDLSTQEVMDLERQRMKDNALDLANQLVDIIHAKHADHLGYAYFMLEEAEKVADKLMDGRPDASLGELWLSRNNVTIAAIANLQKESKSNIGKLYQAIEHVSKRWGYVYPMSLLEGLVANWSKAWAVFNTRATLASGDPAFEALETFNRSVRTLVVQYQQHIQESADVAVGEFKDETERQRVMTELTRSNAKGTSLMTAIGSVDEAIMSWRREHNALSAAVRARTNDLRDLIDALSVIVPGSHVIVEAKDVGTNSFADNQSFHQLLIAARNECKNISGEVNDLAGQLFEVVSRWNPTAVVGPRPRAANLLQFRSLLEQLGKETGALSEGLQNASQATEAVGSELKLRFDGPKPDVMKDGVTVTLQRLTKRLTSTLTRGSQRLKDKYGLLRGKRVADGDIPIVDNTVIPQLLSLRSMGYDIADNDEFAKLATGVAVRFQQLMQFMEIVGGVIPRPMDSLVSAAFATAGLSIVGDSVPSVGLEPNAPQSFDHFLTTFYTAVSNISPLGVSLVKGGDAKTKEENKYEYEEDAPTDLVELNTKAIAESFRMVMLNAQRMLLQPRTFTQAIQHILTPPGSACLLEAWAYLSNSSPAVFRKRSLAQLVFTRTRETEGLRVAFAKLCANFYLDADQRRPTRHQKDLEHSNRLALELNILGDHILTSTRLSPKIKDCEDLREDAFIFNPPDLRRQLAS